MRGTAEARSRRIGKGRLDASPPRPSHCLRPIHSRRRTGATLTVHAVTALPMTPDDFCGWLAKAMPGDATVYYRGHLGRDRCRSTTTLSERDRQGLIALARQAMRAAEDGRVHLLQQRHGDGDYSYIAVKKSHRERRRSHPARPIPRPRLADQHADVRIPVTSERHVPTQAHRARRAAVLPHGAAAAGDDARRRLPLPAVDVGPAPPGRLATLNRPPAGRTPSGRARRKR